MAIANYPKKVRAFPTHRNLLDDVDAAHVNDIQDELVAVMASLGAMPHIYNNIQIDETESGPEESEASGTVEAPGSSWTNVYRFYDPKVKPYDHGNVGNRLDNIERGRQFHCFQLRASGLDLSSSTSTLGTRPRAIKFPKPGPNRDPFKMYDGRGVTLRKSGFWVFAANVVFSLTGQTAGQNNGMYQATIDFDGNYIDGIQRTREGGNNDFPSLNPFLVGFFNRGTDVSLRVSQNSGRNQNIRAARFTGFLLRETVG